MRVNFLISQYFPLLVSAGEHRTNFSSCGCHTAARRKPKGQQQDCDACLWGFKCSGGATDPHVQAFMLLGTMESLGPGKNSVGSNGLCAGLSFKKARVWSCLWGGILEQVPSIGKGSPFPFWPVEFESEPAPTTLSPSEMWWWWWGPVPSTLPIFGGYTLELTCSKKTPKRGCEFVKMMVGREGSVEYLGYHIHSFV